MNQQRGSRSTSASYSPRRLRRVPIPSSNQETIRPVARQTTGMERFILTAMRGGMI
ncbi:MAG: hypothetical protein HYX38_34295 [Rhodospirillales bacterium]|nr:hypothetical protein [Rhodospirillales bacterium]